MVDEKQLKKILKEAGKRGIEIQGVSEMGGLSFFCTKLEETQGDVALLKQAVLEGMNKEVDETSEERSGGAGHVGKMIFSCNNEQLAIVADVPEDKVSMVNAKEWMQFILEKYNGKMVEGSERFASGIVKADQAKGIYPLKIRDESLSAAVGYLRSKGAFPEADSDSESDVAFGDDYDFDAI